ENSSPPTGEELRSPGPLPRPCSPGDDTTLEPPPPLGDGDNSPCSSPSVLKGFTPGQNRVGASHGVWTERDPPAAVPAGCPCTQQGPAPGTDARPCSHRTRNRELSPGSTWCPAARRAARAPCPSARDRSPDPPARHR